MDEEKGTAKKPLLYRLGIGLIIASFLVWLIPIVTPFTPLPTKTKASVIAASIIVAEIMFWSGGLLVGKEVFAKLKKRLNPTKWWNKGAKWAKRYVLGA
ncbi:MAG TPA: transporter suffix domain-containing protein [Clostridia bacterium]|nr:transporter suffix domain-containing protein [Clostridia bacterium]